MKAIPIRILWLLGAAYLFTLGGSRPLVADGLTQQQGDALLKQNQQVLDELRQIRLLLEGQNSGKPPVTATAPAAAPVRISLGPNDNVMGRADAPLTLVEYSDYQCPFCRQFQATAFEEIKKNYIDTGKLRYISRDFPLSVHENALGAAIAAHCAAEQGKFWELRDAMITNANRLNPSAIEGYATALKLDVTRLDTCTASGRYRPVVDRDFEEGRKSGITGTPTFVMGRTAKDVVEGSKIVGTISYAAFAAKFSEITAASTRTD